jgi:hypothetical protein
MGTYDLIIELIHSLQKETIRHEEHRNQKLSEK